MARVKSVFSDPAVLNGAIDYYRAMFRKPERSLRELSPPLDTRGLLVAGGNDFGGHIGPYKKSQAFFTQGAEVLVIPDAGHWPHRESPKMFRDTLLRFL